MKKVKRLFFLFIIVLFYQNCSPFMTNSTNMDLPSTTAFSLNCTPQDARSPSASVLKKISKYELENTLLDLFEPYLDASSQAHFLKTIQPLLAEIPDNKDALGMDLTNQGVTLIHVEKHFLLAEAVSDYIFSDQLIVNRMLANCTTSPDTESCQRNFLKEFGSRALRRPMDVEDIEHYLATMAGHSDSFRNVVAQLLASPMFYYHSEFGSADIITDTETVIQLDNYERANKISYFLLQSMPDAELFAAANSGALSTQSGIAAQVDRLLKNPKVRLRLSRYFANQWLHLNETPELRLDIEEVQSRLRSVGATAPADSLRDELIQEVYDYFYYMIWEQEADYTALMISDLVFPKSPVLSSIYGTKQWNGKNDLASLIRAPNNQRAGVLTRAQFLYTGTGGTRPIMRGVSVYSNFMCQSLHLPPDNSTPEGVVITDEMTDREITQATTEVPGTSCVGCHQRILNPLGFSFDSFDSFGRYRNQEQVFHPEGSAERGQILALREVNPVAEINLKPFVQGQVSGAVDLSRKLSASPDAQACFSSKLWIFAQKQNLNVEENPCAVQSIFGALSGQNGSIIDAIRTLVLQPEFLKRNIQ